MRIEFPHRVVGAVAAAVLIVAGCGGGDGSGAAGSANEPEVDQTEPFEPRSITLELSEREAEGQYGEATLTAVDEETTQVVLELFDGPERRQAAHLHQGTCRDVGKVVHELNALDNGRSATRVDASLEKIVDAGLVLGVHGSMAPTSDHVLCDWVTDENREATG